jgi:hypothetical protein
VRLVTLGVGAQNSPRYAPAGLLLARAGVRVMLDGGPGTAPPERLDAWLVTDEVSELAAAIRRMARARGVLPYAGPFRRPGLRITARPVVQTSHPTCGYVIAHIGRPTLRALDRGLVPPFGEFATDGQVFVCATGQRARRHVAGGLAQEARRTASSRSRKPTILRSRRSTRASPAWNRG